MSESRRASPMHKACTTDAQPMHLAGAALAVAVSLLMAVPAAAGGLVTRWQAAVEGCLLVAETGETAGLTDRGWTGEAAGQESHFRHQSGVMITVVTPVARPEKVKMMCHLSYGSKIPGNDRRGQVLRAALRDLAAGRLLFLEEDQILPPDIYRGCAWDGREFRLSSMTQTGWASFGVLLGPRDRPCAAQVS